jgi:heme-degrading monooxygenase HmoA
MIARVWRGAVAAEDSEAYAEYMRQTGLPGYAEASGNRGAWMLRRNVGERVEFVMLSLWDSLEAVTTFAGAEYERAVFYPEDERFLIERDEAARHFEVVEHVPRSDS